MFTCERLPLFLFESATRARGVFCHGQSAEGHINDL